MLYTEAEIREALIRLGFAPIIGEAAMEMLTRVQEEHDNEREAVHS
jgi:hypothetical protein